MALRTYKYILAQSHAGGQVQFYQGRSHMPIFIIAGTGKTGIFIMTEKYQNRSKYWLFSLSGGGKTYAQSNF